MASPPTPPSSLLPPRALTQSTNANANANANANTQIKPKPKSKSKSKSNGKANLTFHFLAGLLSGLSTSILLQPADLLKTRVQQSRSATLLPALRTILASPHPVRSLWRGSLPSAVRTGFGSAVYFSSLNALRVEIALRRPQPQPIFLGGGAGGGGGTNYVREDEDGKGTRSASSNSVLPRLSNTENLLTGAAARVFAGFLMMPVTVIKVRYESDLYAYRSMMGASRDILATEGVRGFFSGLGATAVRDGPYAGLYVLFYEGWKRRFNGTLEVESGTETRATAAAVNFTSGICAAGLATSLTNPFDAVKTRVQLMPARYGNMFRATKLMLKEDGLRAFFDGLGLRMGRKALSSALAWTVYEELIGRTERRVRDAGEEGGVGGVL